MVWDSHLLKNFPQFIVIHTVKGFGIVNKAEIDVFLELSCFFDDPADPPVEMSCPSRSAPEATFSPQSFPGLTSRGSSIGISYRPIHLTVSIKMNDYSLVQLLI